MNNQTGESSGRGVGGVQQLGTLNVSSNHASEASPTLIQVNDKNYEVKLASRGTN